MNTAVGRAIARNVVREKKKKHQKSGRSNKSRMGDTISKGSPAVHKR